MQNSFCKKCGYDLRGKPTGGKEGMLWKAIVSVVLVILIGSGAFVGYGFWKKKTEEKQAKVYLQQEQKIFTDSIGVINGLSSEIDLVKKYESEENKDLIVEKFSAEKTKADEAAANVSKMKKDSSQAKSNIRVDALNYLVASYFSDADKLLTKYSGYIKFILDEAKMDVELDADKTSFESKFRAVPQDIAGLVGYFKALKTLLDKEVALYDKLEVPAGLADYKKPIDELRTMSGKIGELISALEKKDDKKVSEIAKDIQDSRTLGKSADKANGLLEDYFSQIRNEFSSLRTKADKIKSEFIMTGAAFGVQPLDVSVEGW